LHAVEVGRARSRDHDSSGVVVAWSVAVLAAFALCAWRSWRCWPDILVDFGHELYIPWRLSEGEVLYRDIFFVMGPLSQYFNALLFRLFGVSFTTLIIANLAILGLIVLLIGALFRRFGSSTSSGVVTLFFLTVFAFAQYTKIANYNFISPYRHEITHGLALGLVVLACCLRWRDTRQRHWLAAAGFCLGLVALTKIEMFIPASLVVVTTVALRLLENSPDGAASAPSPARWKETLVNGAIVLGSAGAAPVAALAALAIPLGAGGALRSVFGQWLIALDPTFTTRSEFYRMLGGWDRPAEYLTEMALVTTVIVGVVLALSLLAIPLRNFGRSRFGFIVLGAASCYLGIWLVTPDQWSLLAVAVPPLLVVAVFFGLFRLRRRESPDCGLLLWSLYSLALLPKIVPATSWSHYGFVLAMPGTLLVVHGLVHEIPEWIHRRGASSASFRALMLGLIAACALGQFWSWNRVAKARTHVVGARGDSFLVDPIHDERVAPTARTLDFLRSATPAGQTLAVIPEGTTLNYLLRRRNPTGMLMYNPWEFAVAGGEEHVVERFTRAPPDLVVIVTMDMSPHGSGQFGDPRYGARLQAFLAAEYVEIDRRVATDAAGNVSFRATTLKYQGQRE
jgi:hypothetical protein